MDEDDWAFHRESLGPWDRASDGWVDLKHVLRFLESEHGINTFDAARKLKPAIVRGDISSRVTVLPGHWEYIDQIGPSSDPEFPHPVSRAPLRHWSTDPSDVGHTSTVDELGGWFFVDWERGEARGNAIQVEWRAVLLLLKISKPGDPEPEAPTLHSRRGFTDSDMPLVRRMYEMIQAGQATNPWQAARALAPEAQGSPEGDTRAKRLHALFMKTPFGSVNPEFPD
jgi:hypothetical protein